MGLRRNVDCQWNKRCIKGAAAEALKRSKGDETLMAKYSETWGLYKKIAESKTAVEVTYDQLQWLRVLQDKCVSGQLRGFLSGAKAKDISAALCAHDALF